MSLIRDPNELGAAIRVARTQQGLTQAELAARSGVGRQWLVTVEKGHARAEVGKIQKVLVALGKSLFTNDVPADEPLTRTWLTAIDTARAIREEIERGATDFALRTLGRSLADFHRLDSPGAIVAYLAEPPSTGDIRWDTLLGASTSRACRQRGFTRPSWTEVQPLTTWWFPVFDPVLVARTIQRTPIDLAARGIWLDAKALEVV